MTRIRLKANHFTRDRRLDRIVQFDERSRAFGVRALITPDLKPRSYSWACTYWLDQGADGACTGFGVTHEAGARPVVVAGLTDDTARQVYERAKQLDEWPGEDYEGSSVLAAIKAGQERGWYKSYRWAFGIDDLIMAVGHKGPAVLGVNWYAGQMDTDTAGFVHATGSIMGGHAILCRAANVKREFFTLRQSWGRPWGVNGDCYISFADTDRLLREDGEACIPVQRTKPVYRVANLAA